MFSKLILRTTTLLPLRRRMVSFLPAGKSLNRCDVHANELPIPCGRWDVHYAKRQQFYNRVLISGFLWWLLSFILMLWTNSLYLNCSPPRTPSPQLEMVQTCGDEEPTT